MTTCKRVIYTGQVQGVGFRYTTRRLAAGFAIAGYVRNQPNGSVEVVVEGEPGEIDRFLEALGQRMAGYVADRTIHDEQACGQRGFTIRT
jgi:acylphosphatase